MTFDESKPGFTLEPQDDTRHHQVADMITEAGIDTPATTEVSIVPAYMQRMGGEAADCERKHQRKLLKRRNQ